MKRRALLAAAGVAVIPRSGFAQAYPDRPIRIIVPYAPGGATDTGARALGERLERILGQPIVVENKAGGPTSIRTDTAANAKPDGYNLVLAAAVKAGKVGGLAVATSKRSSLLPDVPTVGEVGLAGWEGAIFNGIVAPAATPPAVVARLNAAINQVLGEPEFRQRLREMGLSL